MKKHEKGNVLFLILIAVALFAALSYAVTQSSRSGGNNASTEQRLLDYSSVQTYAAGLRSAIVRMSLNGTDISEIDFRTPSQFSSMTAGELAKNIYYPTGGGYSYSSILGNTYNVNFGMQIVGIGKESSDTSGNEIVMLLDITGNPLFCELVNKKNNVQNSPSFSQMDNVPTFATSLGQIFTPPVEMSATPNKSEACFEDNINGLLYYYITLVER